MKVRETIRHGDYRNVREVDIERTWDDFVELILGSPYKAAQTAEELARNKYVAQCFADLMTAGKGNLGWADYEVIEHG